MSDHQLNGYPIKLIEQLDNQIKNKRKNPTNDTQTQNKNKKWIIFGYHSPIIRKVTNIFKKKSESCELYGIYCWTNVRT
jgi:hypothetical protein